MGMYQIDLDHVNEVCQLTRLSPGLLESQRRINIFPIFVVAFDWKLDIITLHETRLAKCSALA